MNTEQLINYLGQKLDEAVSFKRRGEYAKSIAIYKECITLASDVPQIYEGYAKTLAVSGNYKDAATYFKLAAKYYNGYNDEKVELCTFGHQVVTTWSPDSADFKTVIRGWSGR